MKDKQHNEELSSMAPKLSAIVKRELHKCPEGYFDGLYEVVMNKIKESPVLNALEKKDLYKAPEGYFDTLSEKVLAKINEAPVLFSLEKKELFEAPEGYFESVNVKSIVQSDKATKIIPIRTTILRWTAVAASVTVMIMTSFYFFGENTKTVKLTASIETTHEEYTNYLMDELPDEDLYAFVSENQSSVTDSTNEVVDYLLDESSDFELENLE